MCNSNKSDNGLTFIVNDEASDWIENQYAHNQLISVKNVWDYTHSIEAIEILTLAIDVYESLSMSLEELTIDQTKRLIEEIRDNNSIASDYHSDNDNALDYAVNTIENLIKKRYFIKRLIDP
jgi:hypothetical protein